MGKRSKSGNKEDENIINKGKKMKKKETKLELFEKNQDIKRIVSEDNETPIISKNEDTCIIKKKNKNNKSLTDDNAPNKKILFDDNVEKKVKVLVLGNKEASIMSKNEDKCLTKKKGKIKYDNTPNKKIIFYDNAEVPINKKKKENKKGNDPKEDEPTEEDIDQFCDEINEEDNVEYENWVQLIEAKLGSNKKKT